MEHECKHGCGHDHTPKRGLHKDWRTWVIVGLMLAAMLAYVMSDNESLRFGGAPPQQPAPADAGP